MKVKIHYHTPVFNNVNFIPFARVHSIFPRLNYKMNSQEMNKYILKEARVSLTQGTQFGSKCEKTFKGFVLLQAKQ